MNRPDPTRRSLKLVRRALFGVVAVVCMVVAVWWVRHEPAAPANSEARRALDLETQLHARRQLEGGSPESMNPMRLIAESAPDEKRIESLRQAYEDYYRYPDNSRPLSEEMSDLLDPLSYKPVAVPLMDREGHETEASGFMYSFTGPAYAVTGDRPFIAELKVWNGKTGETVTPWIVDTFVVSDPVHGAERVSNATFQDDGQTPDRRAGDGIHTISWEPPSEDKRYWGELTVHVVLYVKRPGAASLSAVAKAPFHCTPRAPARFTGNVTEKLENGSLIIAPEIEVFQAGRYHFFANLYHASGTPSHQSSTIEYLESGNQHVRLAFFGKIFHDKQLSGHFELRALRGHRMNLPFDPNPKSGGIFALARQRDEGSFKGFANGPEPYNQYLDPYPSVYRTSSYSLSDFSNEIYDGPDKRKQLQLVAQQTPNSR